MQSPGRWLIRLFLVALIVSFTATTSRCAFAFDVRSLVLPTLETERSRRDDLQRRLSELGPLTLGQTVSQVGAQHVMLETPPPESSWVQLDFGQPRAFDSITLVPAMLGFDAGQPGPYAFPRRFRVDTSDDPEFTTFRPVFDTGDNDFELLDGLPLVIDTPGSRAQYIRLTVTRLANVTGRWTFALSEVIVLAGQRNIALTASVTMPNTTRLKPVWHPDYLVDGRTSLGPPIQTGGVLPVFDGVFNQAPRDQLNAITIDLGRVVPVDEIRLHPVHARQGADYPGYAFPLQFRVESSSTADFETSTTVFATDDDYPNPGNNVVTFAVDHLKAQFVRVICEETSATPKRKFGFAEIEVYANEQNVAVDADVTLSAHLDADERAAQLITDGEASYGPILALPDWIQRWQRARELTTGLAASDRRITQLQTKADRRLRWLSGAVMTSVVVASIGFLFWQSRRRGKELVAFRTQLAADLHDEIGSNLAAIARVGEVAEMEAAEDQGRDDWRSVRELALECTESMRETLWLLGGREQPPGSLTSRLRAIAKRMLAHATVQWTGNSDGVFDAVSEEVQREVVLTFKEVLANTVRHARASTVTMESSVQNGRPRLTVVDDGVGFDASLVTSKESSRGMGLRSMSRRMKAIGGAVEVTSRPGHGTRVLIELPSPSNTRT